MALPDLVVRATRRLLLGGLLTALAMAVVAVSVERVTLGASVSASRAQLAAEVQSTFASLTARLDDAVQSARLEAETLRQAERGDSTATRRLFERVSAVAERSGVSVTVYGAASQRLAWLGRADDVPAERLNGVASLFLQQSSQGLHLVRIQPIADPSDARTVGAIAAQAALPRAGDDPMVASDFTLATNIVPVDLRLPFEGGADVGPDSIVVRSSNNESLAVVTVSDAELAAARTRIRQHWLAAELVLASWLLLLVIGPLLDWRRRASSAGPAVLATVAIALLLVASRFVAGVAVRLSGVSEPPLEAAAPWTTWVRLAVASPLDFLLTALTVAGLVALAATSFAAWRAARRPGVGAIVVDGAMTWALFALTQLAAGGAVTALVWRYQRWLTGYIAQAPVDIIGFALDRIDPVRGPVIVGLIVLNAAVLGAATLVFRFAWSPWLFPGGPRPGRIRAGILWLLPATVWFSASGVGTPPWASLLIVFTTAAAAVLLQRYAPARRHGSQASRLLWTFLAMAVPSVVLYPTLADAADRARRDVVESSYAPEVANQRQDLHTKLEKALSEINRIVALDDLVRASEPPVSGPPSADAAFLVWSQTSLATERLTSSVELHSASGDMVSRFAMNLPDFAQPQPWAEATCEWEVLEEVSPLFSEERRLLHAGRALCLPDGRRAGSVVVHSMLDYANLSFISAQNPYGELVRSAQRRQATRRRDVAFTVYGWSRRVLYSSGENPPPLTEDAFARVASSRQPFWTTIAHGGDTLDAFFLNDRGAIYVLTTTRQSGFGHVVAEAELLAVSFLVFLAAVGGATLFNLITGRTPASGRALLAEIRASFYRKLFLAFVAAAIVPVLSLALVSRAYVANLMLADIENEATRLATVASRVFQDLRAFVGQAAVADDLVVWLSRVIAQDVNIFDGPFLLASSERNLFASGLLPDRTPGEVYRAIFVDGRPSYVGRERAGGLEYLIAATPVPLEGRQAILTIPLASRQQETEAQIEELDRRVLLAAILFIMLGAGIGYYMAERIADPVNRLMRATRRIARGDLDARVLSTSSDELRRLVDAFNQMADDLLRQRGELERTNRLAAWADMARQVAHDIKNPLTPIQLNAEHMRRVHLDQGRPLGTLVDDCVANILSQVRLLRQISSEFSSFATSPQPRPVATNLSELVEEVVEPYRAGLAGRVSMVTDVPATLPSLSIDRTLIGRALTNVIENALHAMPNGGTLRVDAAPASDRTVQLRVTDTGIGMDAEATARIFEPYFSTKAIGTGLGLTIAKRNVEANGGTIAVASEKDRGTRVTIWLPRS